MSLRNIKMAPNYNMITFKTKIIILFQCTYVGTYTFVVPRNIPGSKSLCKTTYLGIYCLNSVEGTKIGRNLNKKTF